MKSHAIIPIFLPHEGCRNDCVFCNQKTITARGRLPEPGAVRATIGEYLDTIRGRGIQTVEIAFFGGSFTGMPVEIQTTYLAIARDFKSRGEIDKIRLSTRPDYINDEILGLLKAYSVDIIELGVQSLDDGVLALSNRGHDSACVIRSAALIKSYGFTLGIQLMIGLPGDTFEKSVLSAEKTVAIGPDIARIYPTIILRDTELEKMYRRGDYAPLDLEEAVRTAKAMCLALRGAGINVIRIGLKSSDFVAEGKDAMGGTYHPAFRQLVEGDIIRDILEGQLAALIAATGDGTYLRHACATFFCSPDSLSDMIGHKKRNRLYFETKYSPMHFNFRTDPALAEGCFRTSIDVGDAGPQGGSERFACL